MWPLTECDFAGLACSYGRGTVTLLARMRCTRAAVQLVVATLALIPCLTFAQTPVLTVDGEVEKRLALSIEDLRAMPHLRSQLDDSGQQLTYEGVPLVEILRRAGLPIGRSPLRGKALTSVVFATGFDGFQAVFALAELDSASPERRVMVVDARDAVPYRARRVPCESSHRGTSIRPVGFVRSFD
jgi:hypothetical protein